MTPRPQIARSDLYSGSEVVVVYYLTYRLYLFRANLNGRLIKFDTEPNGTLLYEASYFDQPHIAKYLLAQKASPDVWVRSQDNIQIGRTALQVAAFLGHEQVVHALLAGKAQVSSTHFSGPCAELMDAIDGCHVAVVKLLVQGQAELFGSEEERRGVDHLFEANNSVLIAAAANGLAQTPGRATGMTLEDFVHFLATPDAESILTAVFRRCELREWHSGSRRVWRTAYVPHGAMNVAVGPAQDHFESRFQQEMGRVCAESAEHEEEEQFFSHLLPWRLEKVPGESQVPVDIFQCVLPGLHRNPEVLWVLSSGVNRKIFDQQGAQAILQLASREASGWQIFELVLDVLMALLFALMALLLHDEHLQRLPELRIPALVISGLILLHKVCQEILSCVGHTAHGKLKQYLCSVGFVGDTLRIAMTGTSLIGLAWNWENFMQDHSLQLIFAFTGFLRWLHVLNSLKAFESTGKPMLPILQAVNDTGPFFFVVFCWFAAFVHLYYSSGLLPFGEGTSLLYNLGILGETNIEDMVPEAERASWRWFVDVVTVAMSFSMSIILMNVLIGVLSESYNRGWEHRDRLFLLEQARFVLDHFTVSYAWSRRPCRRRRVHTGEDADYVWYAHPRPPSSWGDLSTELDAEDQNVHQKVTELGHQLQEAVATFTKSKSGSAGDHGQDVDVRLELQLLREEVQAQVGSLKTLLEPLLGSSSV
eukprot:s3135_g2.t1